MNNSYYSNVQGAVAEGCTSEWNKVYYKLK